MTKTNRIDGQTSAFLRGLNFRYSKIIKCWYSQTLYNLYFPQWNEQFKKDIDQIKKYQSKKGDLGITIMADSEFEDVKTDVNLRKSLEQKKEGLLDKVIKYFNSYFKT